MLSGIFIYSFNNYYGDLRCSHFHLGAVSGQIYTTNANKTNKRPPPQTVLMGFKKYSDVALGLKQNMAHTAPGTQM